MAGRDVIRAQIFGSEFQEGFEFDLFIAQNIRIRCSASLVFSQEQFENVIPVFSGKIDGVQFDSQLVTNSFRVGQIGGRRTIFV